MRVVIPLNITFGFKVCGQHSCLVICIKININEQFGALLKTGINTEVVTK